MGRKSIYFVGQFFGKLEVKEILPSKGAGSHVNLNCLCHYCNNFKIMNGVNMKKRRSCGCQQRNSLTWLNVGAKNKTWQLPTGEAARRNLFADYKRSAFKRNLEFCLTEEQFNILIMGKCFYCGERFTNVKKGQGKTSGNFLYTGIDRIDSSIGYTFENSISCCWMCNNMKHTTEINKFINHIEKIYFNLSQKNAYD